MLKESELARREVGGIVLREGALRVRWEFEDLIASDGHRVNGSFGCMIQALPQPVERKMLEETFLARSASVLTEDIAAHFQPKLEEAARRLIETMTAEAVLSPEGKDAWTKKLAEACNRAAFSCGVSALPPMDAELDSPTVRLEHEEQRRDAQQTERMARAAGLFKQFQEIRASAPELTPGQVLQRIGAADQAEMLRSLLVASGKSSDKQALWAVAGPYLIKISAGALDGNEIPTPQLIELPATVGPLRSVQRAEVDNRRMLLVGARNGVLWVEPGSPEKAIPYIDAEVTSAMGFNGAIVGGGMIWATHAEAGLVAWRIGESSPPAWKIRPAASPVQPFSPRNLFRLADGRVGLSSGDQLMTVSPDGTIGQVARGAGEIVGVIVEERNLITVHDDGMICRRDLKTLEIADRTRRCGKVTAAGGLAWLGSKRLLLATEEGPVYCAGLDDELVTQYVSPYRGLRLVASSALVAAGVSPDRQRLILWPTWDGRKPAAEIHVAGVAKHRVADIEFG